MPITPVLSFNRTKYVDVLNSGEQRDGEVGLRVLLRYPNYSSHDESFEIKDEDGGDFPGLSPVELIEAAKVHGEERSAERILDLIQFAEENMDGVVIGGDHFTWDALAAGGYEFVSRSAKAKHASRTPGI